MKDYYKILNVGPNSTDADIKQSYRLLAKRYHPDVTGGDKNAARTFEEITEAYDILSDAQKRADYDAQRKREEQLAAQKRQWQQQQARNSQTMVTNTAQVAAQMQNTFNKGYEEGYVAGYTAGAEEIKKRCAALEAQIRDLSAENTKLKSEKSSAKNDRADLEKELFGRDREIAQKDDYITDLETQLQWIKSVTHLQTTNKVDPLADKAENAQHTIDDLKREIETRISNKSILAENITTLAQQEQRKQIREELTAISDRLKKLTADLNDIKYIENQKRLLADSDTYIKSMEQRAAVWAKKVKTDKKLARPTHYGTLGILIWATQAEIDEAYERLSQKYAGNPATEDTLREIKDAYQALVSPAKREKYNLSLGYTPEMIESERKLIEENRRLQEEYHGKLAAKAFWAKFDELSSLALAGDANAQNALGEVYLNGVNIAVDYAHAAYWFREAFEQNHPAATYNLSLCYRNGWGVGKNVSIADSMLRQANNMHYTPPPQLKSK